MKRRPSCQRLQKPWLHLLFTYAVDNVIHNADSVLGAILISEAILLLGEEIVIYHVIVQLASKRKMSL